MQTKKIYDFFPPFSFGMLDIVKWIWYLLAVWACVIAHLIPRLF